MSSAHDRHLAGRSSYPCRCVCTDCGEEWDDTYIEEDGTGWLALHEQCPECGSGEIDATETDDEAEREWKDDGIRDPF